eukprot:6476426-Amphidinium_carterae.1
MMQQVILNWIRDTTKKIGTWHLDAAPWFERTVSDAKRMHFRFASSTPKEQASLEKKYVLGRASPILRPEHALEILARCEVLDVLPGWLKSQINIAGIHTTRDVVWFTLKVLQPSPDFLRIGISKDLMARVAEIKTYTRAIQWLEIFYTKMEVAIEAKVRVEPQEVLHHLVNTVQQVCYNDMKATMIWTQLTANEYMMTSDFSVEDVLDLTRDFTIELKLIVQRKRQTAA